MVLTAEQEHKRYYDYLMAHRPNAPAGNSGSVAGPVQLVAKSELSGMAKALSDLKANPPSGGGSQGKVQPVQPKLDEGLGP